MKKSILLVALFGILIMLTSCAKPGEVTVSKYFQAMKLDDKDTMASMAIEPKDVEYKSFEIVSLDEPKVETFALPALLEERNKLEEERKALALKAEDASDDVEDLKDEMAETRRSSRKRELEKEIEEAEKKFDEIKEQYKGLLQKVNDVKKKIEREEALIKMSTGWTENLEMFQGETHLQKVDVKVNLLNGETKDYVFLLRHNVLRLEDKVRKGRLIITRIDTKEDYESGAQ